MTTHLIWMSAFVIGAGFWLLLGVLVVGFLRLVVTAPPVLQ